MLEPLESRTLMSVTPLLDAMTLAPAYRHIHAIVAPIAPYNVWAGSRKAAALLTVSDFNRDGRVNVLDLQEWYSAMWNGVLSPAAQAWWRGHK